MSDQDDSQQQPAIGNQPPAGPFAVPQASAPTQPVFDQNIESLQEQINHLTSQVETLAAGVLLLLNATNKPLSKTDVIDFLNQWRPAAPIQKP
jgi:hypothetical protein